MFSPKAGSNISGSPLCGSPLDSTLGMMQDDIASPRSSEGCKVCSDLYILYIPYVQRIEDVLRRV
jgi:hypothetical protein